MGYKLFNREFYYIELQKLLVNYTQSELEQLVQLKIQGVSIDNIFTSKYKRLLFSSSK